VLAVDSGERRVGLAISDETRLLARPLVVLRRDTATGHLLQQLAAIVDREGVTQIIVGLPLNADGSEGRQARRARVFAGLLARTLPAPVAVWDERLSSREAEDVIRQQGRSPRRVRERGALDAVAAAVFLQQYLDAHPREAAP
jgi:putative Holliday junction resolvase